jgi:hypothetical protein
LALRRRFRVPFWAVIHKAWQKNDDTREKSIIFKIYSPNFKIADFPYGGRP